MSKEKIKLWVGYSLLAVASLILFLSTRTNPPVDRATHEAIGTLMGRHAIELLGGGAGRLVVITRDIRNVRNPAAEIQLHAFQKAIAGKARIALTNVAKLDPLRVPIAAPGDVYQLMKRSGETDLIVSFAGPPNFPDTPQFRLPGKAPKVLALCTGAVARQANLKALFKRGLLTRAVVDKEGATRATKAPSDPQAIFDQYYQIINATSLETQASLAADPTTP